MLRRSGGAVQGRGEHSAQDFPPNWRRIIESKRVQKSWEHLGNKTRQTAAKTKYYDTRKG